MLSKNLRLRNTDLKIASFERLFHHATVTTPTTNTTASTTGIADDDDDFKDAKIFF